jgi:hypothetical protein
VAVRSTCNIARTSRNRNKPENIKIIEYRSEMRQKIDGNIAGVHGVSRIRVQSVCGLIGGTFVDKDLVNALDARVFFPGPLCLGVVDPAEVSGPDLDLECFLTGNR